MLEKSETTGLNKHHLHNITPSELVSTPSIIKSSTPPHSNSIVKQSQTWMWIWIVKPHKEQTLVILLGHILGQTIKVTWCWRSPSAIQIIKCFCFNHMRHPTHPHTHSNHFIYRLQTEMTSWLNLIVNNGIIHENKLPKWGYTHKSNLWWKPQTWCLPVIFHYWV